MRNDKITNEKNHDIFEERIRFKLSLRKSKTESTIKKLKYDQTPDDLQKNFNYKIGTSTSFDELNSYFFEPNQEILLAIRAFEAITDSDIECISDFEIKIEELFINALDSLDSDFAQPCHLLKYLSDHDKINFYGSLFSLLCNITYYSTYYSNSLLESSYMSKFNSLILKLISNQNFNAHLGINFFKAFFQLMSNLAVIENQTVYSFVSIDIALDYFFCSFLGIQSDKGLTYFNLCWDSVRILLFQLLNCSDENGINRNFIKVLEYLFKMTPILVNSTESDLLQLYEIRDQLSCLFTKVIKLIYYFHLKKELYYVALDQSLILYFMNILFGLNFIFKNRLTPNSNSVDVPAFLAGLHNEALIDLLNHIVSIIKNMLELNKIGYTILQTDDCKNFICLLEMLSRMKALPIEIINNIICIIIGAVPNLPPIGYSSFFIQVFDVCLQRGKPKHSSFLTAFIKLFEEYFITQSNIASLVQSPKYIEFIIESLMDRNSSESFGSDEFYGLSVLLSSLEHLNSRSYNLFLNNLLLIFEKFNSLEILKLQLNNRLLDPKMIETASNLISMLES